MRNSLTNFRMSEAADKEKSELRELLERAQSQVPQLNEGIANVDAVSSELRSAREALSAEVGRVFDSMAEALERRRQELLAEVKAREQEKQVTLGEWKRKGDKVANFPERQ